MTKKQKHMKIHEEAMIAFSKVQSTLYEERHQCLEDRRFYSIAGAQWEGKYGEQFENKPQMEINKVHLAVMKIINEYRNNRVTAQFTPKDGSPENTLSDTCNGLFRADEQDSIAEEAYDNAFEEAVGGGFGAFRITSEYEDEEDDENEKQRIRIEPIYDADSSVFFDMDAKRQDKADAKWCMVISAQTPEDFEEEWGVDPTSVNKEIEYKEFDWYTPNMVYVAEYYRVERKRETIRVFENISGEEMYYCESDFEENPDLEEELRVTGSKEVRTRNVWRKKIHKYIMSGNEILEDCGILAGKNIPIVPVYGKRWYVDSVERCMGHVRLVKDIQRVKNMLTSKLAEISALSPVEKPVFTPEQMDGHAQMWADDNIKNYPYLHINSLPDANGVPQSVGQIATVKPPKVPPALAALLQLVDMDIKELLGNHTEADKMISHVSGKAQEMLQKRIDGQAFIYMSNFAKAVRRAGEIWLSMAKEVYVEEGRKMKTLDTSGQMSSVELYTPKMENNLLKKENDLSKASFDVAVDVGPASSSARQATVTALTGMLSVTQDPEIAKVLQAMIMMNMEGEGITDARKYFRKQLVGMGVIPPTPEEQKQKQMEEAAKNRKPDPQERALNAMAEEAEAKAQKTKAEVMEVISSTHKDKADVNYKEAQTAQIYSNIANPKA